MIMILAFLSFFKKLLSGDLTVVFITVMIAILGLMAMPTISKIAGAFGYETKQTLKDQLVIEKKNTDTLEAAKKVQDKTIEILEDTVDNTEKTLAEKVVKEKVIKKKIDVIQKKLIEKTEEVKALDVPETQKEESLSAVRISSVWQAFCTASDDPQCAQELKGVT